MAPPGTLTAHERFCLVLLCSQSDTVRRGSLRKTQTSTPPPTGSCQDPAMHSRRDFNYYNEIRSGCQLLRCSATYRRPNSNVAGQAIYCRHPNSSPAASAEPAVFSFLLYCAAAAPGKRAAGSRCTGAAARRLPE